MLGTNSFQSNPKLAPKSTNKQTKKDKQQIIEIVIFLERVLFFLMIRLKGKG